MFEVIYRLLEMLALVLCLHSLSGEKVKFDIYNAGFIVIELTFMQMIRDGIVSKQLYFAVYLIYFVYAYVKFKDTIQRTILKCLLTTFVMCGLQIVIYVPMYFASYYITDETVIVLIVNTLVFMFLFFTKKSNRYSKMVEFCASRDWILRICVAFCVLVAIYCMFTIKLGIPIKIDVFIIFTLFMLVAFVFVYRWQKSVYELENKEKEIQLANLYNDAFGDLITTIRRKQHDFHNHIDAIYSSHLTAKSLDELVAIQKEYCDNVVYQNRHSKVLGCVNNSTLAGFIYTKLLKAEQFGIDVEYDIAYRGNSNISVYNLVEIIGIFMDNAIEALVDSELPQKIIFSLNDYEGLDISVKNPVTNIANTDIEKFFEKEYTTKTSGSGIGLSKIKEFQKKYKYSIHTCIQKENNIEWIEFRVVENK